jgi:hypothetical protein
MATTTGYVQRLTLLQSSRVACAWVGPSPSSTELLTISLPAGESDAVARHKHSLIRVLGNAQIARREVDVRHPDDSAAIDQVSFTPRSDTAPVWVDGIEVTQGIQDLALSIPLLAGKRTVVRVYLSHPDSPGITVRGEIAVRRGPSDVPFVIESENVAVLSPAEAGNLPVKREDVDRSLNFVLPATQEGPLAIEIASITNTVTSADVAFSGDPRPAVWFHPSAPLRLRIVGFRYTQGAVAHVPTPLDFALLQSWLGRAYPVGQMIVTTTIADAAATVPFGCGAINAELAAMRVLDMDAGGDERTHYYGLVSDGGFFMRGCAGVPAEPSPDAVGSGPTGPGTWGWDDDGSYGDWYGGHELGHTYGRRHPGFCGETESDLDNYPFENGQLANGDDSFIGFDVGDPANGIAMRALPGTQWHDVMTYCDRQWLSAYTYLGIRRRLEAEDALGPSGGSGPVPGPGAGSPAFSGGRPDARFPHAKPRTKEAAARLERTAAEKVHAEEAARVTVSVVATVNLTTPSGMIRHVTPLEHRRAPKDVGENAVLRVSAASGEAIGEFPVAVRLDSEIAEGEDLRGIIDAIIDVDPAARLVELVVGGKVVDRQSIGGALPQMRPPRIESAREGLRVTGEAEQAEGVTYAVQVSTDGGRSWQTVALGLKTPSTEIDRRQFAPGQRVRVRVIATNGLQRSVVMTDESRN